MTDYLTLTKSTTLMPVDARKEWKFPINKGNLLKFADP